MKRQLLVFTIALVLFSLVSFGMIYAEDNVQADNQQPAQQTSTTTSSETTTSTTNTVAETTSAQTDTQTDATSALADTENKNAADEFNVDPGMTPDNALYFIKDTYQRIVVGNDPEKALDYREQKIAEAKAMVEKGNEGAAEKSLDRALEYGDIVEKEVNPKSKDEVQQRSEIVQNVIVDLENKVENVDVKEKFDQNLEKEKKINNAVELVAKINELCQALAKIDPLQYADSCKSKDNSPRWMKEQDKELTKEQQENAKLFVEKLSQCFENPKNCDCKGMGVQSFEDFCIEKSSLAVKCKNGDKDSCAQFEKGADPSELLPDYLVSSFRQIENKYIKSEFDMYTPKECIKAGAKTPEDCNKIMFKLDSPQECIDAGLTGKSQEDETKCKKIMFEKNTPQECIDAGINSDDPDAPRKCAKIIFSQRSPQECINAGITGERRDDEKRCRELIINKKEGKTEVGYAPKFNRDCNSIKDANEKMKCYEEFYNNAQVQVKDDFRQREMVDQNTGEKITAEEEAQRKVCRDKGMNTILEYENGKRVVICVDKNYQGNQGGQKCPDGICDDFEKNNLGTCPQDCEGQGTDSRCQTQQQIENLKQDCRNRGQDAIVENRGGCPWVICTGGAMQGINRQQQTWQQTQQVVSVGQKCPDNICDEYERMNPYACPEDCGGTRSLENYQQTQNIIDQPQQPNQQPGQQVCSGQAPGCVPNGAPFCDNGNWVCPQPQQQPTQQITEQPQQPVQEPTQQPAEQPQVQQPIQEQQPSESAPVTGGVVSIDNENIDNQKEFWDYWFVKSN